MMKQLVGFLALCFGLNLVAQTSSTVPISTAPTVANAPTAPAATRLRTAEELEKLVAPIALYPDSLLALILPASTESSDIVMAVRFLNGGGDVAAVESEPWADSVKSLTRFPDVLKWMDTNLEWTRDLGDAFLVQSSDVMNAVQRLRLSARSSGVLADTPEQRVVVEAEEVRIIPARVDYIYVPYYDPDILFVRHFYTRPLLTFSVGFSIGYWLHFDCDWHARSIWMHPRHRSFVYTPGWRPPAHRVIVTGRPVPVVWAPRPGHVHHPRPVTVVHRPVAYPRPMVRPDPHHPAPHPTPHVSPQPKPAPRHDDHRSPVATPGPRKQLVPTPAPNHPVERTVPNNNEWRDRPRGQIPSHGHPSAPAVRTESRREEPTRRVTTPSQPTSNTSKKVQQKKDADDKEETTSSTPARGNDANRGHNNRDQR